MERKGLIPTNDSFEYDSSNGLHTEKAEMNNISDHELGSELSEDDATPQSFSWSLRKVVLLASLCLVCVVSFGVLSVIAPFYPHEVSASPQLTGNDLNASHHTEGVNTFGEKLLFGFRISSIISTYFRLQ